MIVLLTAWIAVSHADPGASTGVHEAVRGSLVRGDMARSDGTYVDAYERPCWAGVPVQARLTSDAFDTYVAIKLPGADASLENDDAASGPGASVGGTPTQDGACRIYALSYKPRETGDYLLELDGFGADPTATPAGAAHERVTGALGDGDRRLDSGELVDVVERPCRRGVPLRAVLTSSDFDTYLGLRLPGESESRENDDTPNVGGAMVEGTPSEDGACRFMITSSRPGESGAYVLDLTSPGATSTAPAAPPAAPPVVAVPSPSGPLTGQLDAALRGWAGGFAGHLGARDESLVVLTTYATDLRLEGATEMSVMHEGATGDWSLRALFAPYADEASGLAAWRALVGQVSSATPSCCRLDKGVQEEDGVHTAYFIPSRVLDGPPALANAMITVELLPMPVASDPRSGRLMWVLHAEVRRQPR